MHRSIYVLCPCATREGEREHEDREDRREADIPRRAYRPGECSTILQSTFLALLVALLAAVVAEAILALVDVLDTGEGIVAPMARFLLVRERYAGIERKAH